MPAVRTALRLADRRPESRWDPIAAANVATSHASAAAFARVAERSRTRSSRAARAAVPMMRSRPPAIREMVTAVGEASLKPSAARARRGTRASPAPIAMRPPESASTSKRTSGRRTGSGAAGTAAAARSVAGWVSDAVMLMTRSYGHGAAGPGRRAPLASRLPVVAAAAAVALAMLQVAGAAGTAGGGPQSGSDGSSSSPDPKKGREPGKVWPPQAYPGARSVARARGFAAAAPGRVTFAVTGAGEGVRGLGMDEPFSSASVSKAMLLAAEVRRLPRGRAPLDDATPSLL